MFFVCLLRLAPKYVDGLSNGIDVPLVPQEEEIAMVEWMEMEDYCNQDLWVGSPLYGELNNAIIRAANSFRSEHGMELKQITSTETTTIPNKTVTQDCNEDGGVDVDAQCGFVAKNLPVGFRPGANTIYLSKL
mmetsp:Transcript_2347/g.2706  ORF Transcript_2347/g.2706 Transcript_2347/m.2706 type:complete len:133 (+) Transcript_2347:96-494(+)